MEVFSSEKQISINYKQSKSKTMKNDISNANESSSRDISENYSISSDKTNTSSPISKIEVTSTKANGYKRKIRTEKNNSNNFKLIGMKKAFLDNFMKMPPLGRELPLSHEKQNENKFNTDFTNLETGIYENTVILKINVKLSTNKVITLSLKKYDNIYITLKKFLKENKIENNDLIRPLAYKIFCALFNISSLYNFQINKVNKAYLISLFEEWREAKND